MSFSLNSKARRSLKRASGADDHTLEIAPKMTIRSVPLMTSSCSLKPLERIDGAGASRIDDVSIAETDAMDDIPPPPPAYPNPFVSQTRGLTPLSVPIQQRQMSHQTLPTDPAITLFPQHIAPAATFYPPLPSYPMPPPPQYPPSTLFPPSNVPRPLGYPPFPAQPTPPLHEPPPGHHSALPPGYSSPPAQPTPPLHATPRGHHSANPPGNPPLNMDRNNVSQ